MPEGNYTKPFTKRVPVINGKAAKAYVYNNDYIFKQSSRRYYDPDTGVLNFTVDEEVNIKKRRCINEFSTRFAHTGVVLENDPRNLESGLHRIFACRVPTRDDGSNETDPILIRQYEEMLRFNITTLLAVNGHRWADKVREQTGDMHFDLDREEAIKIVTQQKHSKQKMRLNEYLNTLESGAIVSFSLGSKHVDIKCKYPEIAKPGKNIRLIIDCRVGRSLIGSLYMSSLKHHIGDRELVFGKCRFIFITGPKTDIIMHYFHELARPTDMKLIVAFSDDACFSDGQTYGNADISSCDVTHTDAHYHWTTEAFQFPEFIKTHLTEQQLGTHVIVNPHNKTEKIHCKPKRRKQQSGSTYTSLWNLALWLAIAIYWGENDCTLMEAAQACGTVITVDFARRFQDLQFLKFSPALDVNGIWRAVMNPGVLFRMSGRMKNDIPAKYKGQRVKTFQERCDIAQSQLVNGYLQYFSCPEFEHLRPRKDVTEIQTDDFKIRDIQSGSHKFTLYELMQRYEPTLSEIAQLSEQLQKCTRHTVVYNSLVSKVLLKDYGLTTPLLL